MIELALFMICLPFAYDNCEWDLQLTESVLYVDNIEDTDAFSATAKMEIDMVDKVITLPDRFWELNFIVADQGHTVWSWVFSELEYELTREPTI